jgi:hypothetical protein
MGPGSLRTVQLHYGGVVHEYPMLVRMHGIHLRLHPLRLRLQCFFWLHTLLRVHCRERYIVRSQAGPNARRPLDMAHKFGESGWLPEQR